MKFAWEGGQVTGTWDVPEGPTRAGLVLGHGAGSDYRQKELAAVAAGLASRGIAVLRYNFGYSEAGRRAPDTQPKLEACARAVAAAAAEQVAPLFLGGKSMGGRIASHVVADGFPAAGLVFLGYPLHPPGKPERIRDAHLPRVTCPMLFLQGTRDSFARPDLLATTVASLPRATLVLVEGGDHSFKVTGRPQGDVVADLVEAIVRFVEDTLGSP